jgi:FkbM family methyltransferase
VAIGTNTFWLDPASDFGARLLEENSYEPALTRCLERLLKPGEVFLDVGANEGWFSVQAAQLVGSDGRVFAVEPQQRLWPVLLRNFSLNRLTHCVLLPYAISSRPGHGTLTLAPDLNTGASTLVPMPRQFLWRKQLVVTMALDDLTVLNREQIALAKVDVEGFEVEVVRSAAQLMARRNIQRWLIETHPEQLHRLGTSVGKLESILQSNGYHPHTTQGVTIWTLV